MKDGTELPGIDLRGMGGFITAPPSVHWSGKKYEWAVSPESMPYAPCPEWIIEGQKPQPISYEYHGALDVEISDKYIKSAIEKEESNILTASKGERNSALNIAAHSLAQFIPHGLRPAELK